MALFTPRNTGKSVDKSVISKSKIKQKSVTTIKGGTDILSRINQIKATVETNLGQYKDEYQVITDSEILEHYTDSVIKNKYISIDTETDGLDPLQNNLAGICIYTHGEKGSYIPLNHISYITNTKASGQLEADIVREQFQRILDANVFIDMFNAKFDIRFLRAFGLKDIYCNWDGYLASRILNENEEHKNLKQLHNKYCLDGKGDAFRFDDLFKGIPFTMIPYNVGYLYAAHDPVITAELNEYQRKYLTDKTDREDIKEMYWVFKNIEMPCVPVVADMEDNGILIDIDYIQKLSDEYNSKLKEAEEKFYRLCDDFGEDLDRYREEQGNNNKLEYPINISSSSQIAIMLYDVLKVKPVDKRNPRGTGEEILSKIKHPIAQAVLKYREIKKLLTTYIEKMPQCANPNDGRIHCSFNQYGADTGRFSSSDPNLQNIPSHNKDIRKMFVASPGYVLMSSDFSQQEPKCLAALCRKQGDDQMYNTFMKNKDLYSEIASKAFNKSYEDCLEFYLDENGNKTDETNKEGKERRTQAKSILLGVLYGRGEASIAEQLNCSVDKAKEIKNSVFRGFPAIKQFEEDSLLFCEAKGYVTTVCGRKRRLPNLQLPEFEFKWKDGAPPDDDLLDFDFMNSPEYNTDEVPDDRVEYYLKKLDGCWGKEKREIFDKALEEGILIIDNGAKIADARRQCVNARIQGSAADLTKLAMIDLRNNEELKRLGFKLLIPVHDEVIAECPEENVKECSRLLAETMSKAAEKILEMPIKCDVEVTKQWYGEKIEI